MGRSARRISEPWPVLGPGPRRCEGAVAALLPGPGLARNLALFPVVDRPRVPKALAVLTVT